MLSLKDWSILRGYKSLWDAYIQSHLEKELKLQLWTIKLSQKLKIIEAKCLLATWKNKLEFEEKLVGKEAEVLFESYENGIYEGHTMNYVKVHVQSDMDLIGEIAQ